MSKKGRTSIVLLGSLVLCLICIPLAFMAYGAKVDRTALNRRIALLRITARRYRQHDLLPVRV
jgi:hypothetical protein